MEYYHVGEVGVEEHLYPYRGAVLLRYSPERKIQRKDGSFKTPIPAILQVIGIVNSYRAGKSLSGNDVSDCTPILGDERRELTDILSKKWDADIIFSPDLSRVKLE